MPEKKGKTELIEKTKPELTKKENSVEVQDIIIIGSGMAGMTAAIYAARAERQVLIIESQLPGGRITTTDVIENWPTQQSISGMSIGEILTKQVESFKVKTVWKMVQTITKSGNLFKVSIEDDANQVFFAKTIIVATGVNPRKLGVPGEKEYRGRGVSYCATCDGPFYKNKNVVVVGGGDAAVKEAMYLAKFAQKVTIIHRRERLRAEKIIIRKALENPKLEIIWNTTVEEINGEGGTLTGVKVRSINTEQARNIFCDGVFLYVGNKPNTRIVEDLVKLTEDGYILAREDTRTSLPGLFAAGDVRVKELRQLVTAAADGAVAAFMADEYIERNF